MQNFKEKHLVTGTEICDSDSNLGHKILAIDDQRLNLRILESSLSREGFTIFTAQDGEKGYQLARREKPDLIILDVMMPGLSGFDVIARLKKDPVTHDIPVIFLTARNEIDAKLEGFELGAVDFITKPFNIAEVKARVRIHLKLRLATRALVRQQAAQLAQVRAAQESLLLSPADLPAAGFDVCYEALQEAGGDFYDVAEISPGIFSYFVADVSGHDLGAGFITPSVKALVKQNCRPVYGAAESVRLINQVLVEILPLEKYLTAVFVRLNRRKGELEVVNAGHPPMLLVPRDGVPRLVEQPGDILGMFPRAQYFSRLVKVKAGDRFFLLSDGLLETPSSRSVWTAGTNKLLKVAAGLEKGGIGDAVKLLKNRLLPETRNPEDDVVLLGVEV
jgi:sigma-B regulation protein RsbU (phosphoserine phosphatase)